MHLKEGAGVRFRGWTFWTVLFCAFDQSHGAETYQSRDRALLNSEFSYQSLSLADVCAQLVMRSEKGEHHRSYLVLRFVVSNTELNLEAKIGTYNMLQRDSAEDRCRCKRALGKTVRTRLTSESVTRNSVKN